MIKVDTLSDHGLVKSELINLKKSVIGQYRHNFIGSNDIARMLLKVSTMVTLQGSITFVIGKIKSTGCHWLKLMVLSTYLNSQDVRVVLVGDEPKMGDLTPLRANSFLSPEDPQTLKRQA